MCRGWPRRCPIKALAPVVGGTFGRVQFTPDLVPADMIGTRIYRPPVSCFTRAGPGVRQLLLADEINRAPAKVQSALLEVMAGAAGLDRRQDLSVPHPFLVLATQNPIESEGVYPLPEAQLDRFLFKVLVDYPRVRRRRSCTMGVAPPMSHAPADARRPPALQQQAAQVFVDRRVTDYAATCAATRTPAAHGLGRVAPWVIQYGASRRARASI